MTSGSWTNELTVKVPPTRYVELVSDIEFKHDHDEDGLPIQADDAPWQNMYHAFTVLEPGTICEILLEICDRDPMVGPEYAIRPVKKRQKHMTATVYPWTFKALSPLVLLAMQAESESDFDGV